MRPDAISRRECLRLFGSAAAAGLAGSLGIQAPGASSLRQPVRLVSWDLVRAENNCMRRSEGKVLRITASNGIEAGLPAHICDDLSGAADLLRGRDLLDHEALFDFMVREQVPFKLRRAIDMLGWDLDARTGGESLAGLLGAGRNRIRRYGDVRWRDGDTPGSYAEKVRRHIDQQRLTAVKLHVPGVDHHRKQLPMGTLLATLRAARDAAGTDAILAYDPQPGWAAATEEDALAILQAMEEEGYEWLEEPFNWNAEGALEKYVALRPRTPIIVQQEENGDCGYGRFIKWAGAGAVGQWTYDVLIHGSITEAVRILRWATAHWEKIPVRVNFHWAWTPHVHLAASVAEEIAPYFEDPYSEEIERAAGEPAFAAVPDWPGIYRIDGLNT